MVGEFVATERNICQERTWTRGLDNDAKYVVGFGFNTLFVAAHADGGRSHGQR